MKTAWIGAVAVALLASTTAWALPSAPMSGTAVTARAEPLLLIRHHHRHGHWRHYRSYGPDDDEPEAAGPDTTPPRASALPQPIERPVQNTPGATSRGSGSSRPAIRWVDPEKSPR